MLTCVHQAKFSNRRNRRQDKWKRRLTQLAAMRAAKARLRQERVDAGLIEREPKMERYYRFEFGLRWGRVAVWEWDNESSYQTDRPEATK